jgi:DNA-binding CsgD family transcriptional regulator
MLHKILVVNSETKVGAILKTSSSHFSYASSDLVSDICKPIVAAFNANLFIYQRSIINEATNRVFSNSYLCNNAEVLSFILSLPKENREPAKYDYSKNRKYVLMDYTQPVFASMLHKKFNINCVISRDERIKTNEWEHLIIGSSTNDTAIINAYINNIGMIDKFASYFRSKAIKLIIKACNNCFASGRPLLKCSFARFNDFPILSSQKYSVVPDPKHYYLTDLDSNMISIPQTEMKYLIMLSHGRTAKEIAATYNVSSRTVENSFRIAKYRLKCSTKKEILDTIEEWKKSNFWAL